MSNDHRLKEFGRLLIEQVREAALTEFERDIAGDVRGIGNQRVHRRLASLDHETQQLARDVVQRAVDQTIGLFLHLVESRPEVDLLWHEKQAPVSLKEVSDGLAGELWGAEGWIARYGSSSGKDKDE